MLALRVSNYSLLSYLLFYSRILKILPLNELRIRDLEMLVNELTEYIIQGHELTLCTQSMCGPVALITKIHMSDQLQMVRKISYQLNECSEKKSTSMNLINTNTMSSVTPNVYYQPQFKADALAHVHQTTLEIKVQKKAMVFNRATQARILTNKRL